MTSFLRRKTIFENLPNGYFTVEAALILPLTLGVIVLLIYLMFYQYDRCLLDQDMGWAALRASVTPVRDNVERLEVMRQQTGKIYLDKYVAFRPDEIIGRIQGEKLEMSRKAAVKFPFAAISGWIGSGGLEMEAFYSNRNISPVVFIRAFRRVSSQPDCG